MHLTHACDLEESLYRRWESLSGRIERFHTIAGESVTVLSPGRRNDLAGPDFSDAVLLIDNRLVVGPVEMHRREADWFAHGHHDDPAYHSVRLHVLAVPPPGGSPTLSIPTLVLSETEERAVVADDRSNDAITEDVEEDDHRDLSLRLAEASWHRFLRRVGEQNEAITESGREGFRRHLLIRLFDALGYSANRTPMRALAEALWELRELALSPRDLLLHALDLADLRKEKRERIERMVDVCSPVRVADPLPGIRWDYAVRPGSDPEIRILAGVLLYGEIVSGRLIRDAMQRIRRDDAVGGLRRILGDATSNMSLLGIGRRDEMIVNVLLPAIVASAVRIGDGVLIDAACRVYRGYPSLASNRLVRTVERRWNGGRAIAGAFFQQGAIELHQTLLVSSDRT